MEANENLFEHGKHRPTLEELFGSFIEAAGCQETLAIFQNIKNSIDLGEHEHSEVYDRLKTRLTSWKCQSLWDLLDARAKHVEYGKGKICNHLSVLIIGGGPIGLRTAIETALLGCRTVIVEKRREFTRNNVLHLWPFLLTDFRGLGAKKFYGKFCAGSIDHISKPEFKFILREIRFLIIQKSFIMACLKEYVYCFCLLSIPHYNFKNIIVGRTESEQRSVLMNMV